MKIRKGVIGIIFRMANGKPEFLILHRKLHWHGWEFPKGGIKGSENEEDTLRRELEEETGLKKLDVVSKVPYTVSYEYPDEFKKQFDSHGARQHVYLVRYRYGEIRLSSEHDDFRWASFEDAVQMLKHDSQKRALESAFEMLQKMKI